jgi:hypothetical protein
MATTHPINPNSFTTTEFDQLQVNHDTGLILSRGDSIRNTATGTIEINSANIKTGTITLVNNDTISNTESGKIDIGTARLKANSIELASGDTISNTAGGIIDAGSSTINASIIDVPEDGALRIGGTNINTAGTLSNVAYKDINNAFQTKQSFDEISIEGNFEVSNSLTGSAFLPGMTPGDNSVIVSNTAVTANSMIFLTRKGDYSGVPLGNLWVSHIVPGSSFTINSDESSEGAEIQWLIVNRFVIPK